jgi:hypothetical protein
MANLPDTMETALLDYYLQTANSTNYATHASFWVGLCTGAYPTDSSFPEVTQASYSRRQITFSTASGGQATGPAVSTAFPSASASWGTLYGYGVFSASTGTTGTTYLFHSSLNPTVAVTTNDTVSFAANAMTLTMA